MPHEVQPRPGKSAHTHVAIIGTGFAATDPIGPMQITGHDGADLREIFQASDW